MSGVIARVEVTPGQQVVIGRNSDLQWTVHAIDGALVPVTPGSAFFTVTEGGDKLQVAAGQAKGLVPGVASVTARVDGITSVPTTIRVTSPSVVTIIPDPAIVSINGSLNFTAQVSQTGNQNVTWSVVEQGGGTITRDGRYQAPDMVGTYTIRAVSQYDPEKSATVPVTVQEGSISVGGNFPESGGIGVEID